MHVTLSPMPSCFFACIIESWEGLVMGIHHSYYNVITWWYLLIAVEGSS